MPASILGLILLFYYCLYWDGLRACVRTYEQNIHTWAALQQSLTYRSIKLNCAYGYEYDTCAYPCTSKGNKIT